MSDSFALFGFALTLGAVVISAALGEWAFAVGFTVAYWTVQVLLRRWAR